MSPFSAIAAALSGLVSWLLRRPVQSLKDDLADEVPELERRAQERADERAKEVPRVVPTQKDPEK